MGIRMLHRRTAHARVHATAATGTRVRPHAAAPRPLPALAPGAATPRVPGTPATALRAVLARLRAGALDRVGPLVRLARRVRREGRDRLTRLGLRLRAGVRGPWFATARGYLALAVALGTLDRLRRRRRTRRITLFVVPMPAPVRLVPPVSERPDGSAPRR